MNFKKFLKSKNLFDKNNADIYPSTIVSTYPIQWAVHDGVAKPIRIPCLPNTRYAMSIDSELEQTIFRVLLISTDNVPEIGSPISGTLVVSSSADNTAVFTTRSNTKYLVFQVSASVFDDAIDSLMLVAGSQPLPYEPYDSEVWHDIPYYQHKTATDTLTLPATLYPNDTSITVGIKGQSSQSGTPSPSNPVDVNGVGELETSGEHAGQYKIPILSAGQTNNIYLGEVESTRQIKKKVFDGTEAIDLYEGKFFTKILDGMSIIIAPYSSHYTGVSGSIADMPLNSVRQAAVKLWGQTPIPALIFYNEYTSIADFKSYLQQQYTNGTPVCVWYVLAEPTTATVNEPLMKIGSYSDSLTTSIPVTAGSNTLDVQTTVAPSEVTAGFSGWHPVSAAHERENGQWD
jgi:hypothetical protein